MKESLRARWMSIPVAILAVALFAPSLSAQRDRFQETTTVTLVEVPVQVSSKGEPVRGLTADDFEVTDGKKKVDIVAFEVVDLSTENDGTPAASDIPLAGRRHFLAFFDLSLSDPNAITKAREAAADLVLNSLHPTDMVGVATYSQSKGPQMVLGFTTDRNQVRQAIETLGLYAPTGAITDPLGLVIGDISSESQPTGGGSQAGIDAQAEFEATIRELSTLRGQANRGEQISVVARLMDALGAVGQLMQSVEGRKHVLLLSEGFDGELLFGTEDIGQILADARAVEEGRTQDVDSSTRFGDSEARRVVDRTLEVFRQSNTSIQAVDIGGLGAGGSVTGRGRAGKDTNLDALQYIARETGGEMFANYNDLGNAMGDMLARTSVTYLLAFSPKDLPEPGEFREIKVKLKGGGRGTDVIHRPGYYAPRTIDQKNPFEQRLEIADQLIGGKAGGAVAASVLATAFPVSGAQAYVPVLIEANGNDLLRNHTEDVVPIQIYAYALDQEAAVRDFFVRNLGLDRGQVEAAFQNTGFKYWGHFDLDPGEYTVRVVVRNPATGASGLDVSTFTVAAADSQQTALLPPLFPETPGKWVMGREDESEQRPGVDYPYMMAGNPFIPAARPEVKSGEQAQMNLVAYNLGEGSLAISGQLFTDTGDTVNGGEVSLGGGAAGATGQAQVPAVFNATRVAPGNYVLVVTLRNTVTQKEETSSIPIRVVG